jgi:hypothetical protein
MSSNVCPSCNYKNRIGELFCQDCGNPLFDGGKARGERSTRQLDFQVPELKHTPIWGTSMLGKNATVILQAKNNKDPLNIQPKPEMVIGRSDIKSNHYPDIDLTPYGAVEEGVSRVHARFRYEGTSLTVSDMESVNGTFVNGQRLPPGMDRVLRDGDEIRFGRLVMNIYFK